MISAELIDGGSIDFEKNKLLHLIFRKNLDSGLKHQSLQYIFNLRIYITLDNKTVNVNIYMN